MAAGLHGRGAGWAGPCGGRGSGRARFLAVAIRGAIRVSSVTVTRGACDGFETVVVDTGLLSLSLIPELGGKINSLRDRRTGREWLWRNPRQVYQRAPAGSAYVAVADTGGWDECLPTVAPCP